MTEPVKLTPERVIADAIAEVCSDGGSDANAVARDIITALSRRGYVVRKRPWTYKPITEGYQPGSQIQKSHTPQATSAPTPPNGGSSVTRKP